MGRFAPTLTLFKIIGHGIPQVTAIFEVWRAVKEHGDATGYYVPIVADGGMLYPGVTQFADR